MADSDKNYITPAGFEKLQSEYHQLLNVERPKLVETVAWAASNGDRSENADYIYGKRRLREIDSRLRFLTKRLEIAVVVDPKKQSGDQVIFGSKVWLSTEDGDQKCYQIVGEDEWDLKKGQISWKSPMAKALLGKRAGDEAKLLKPKGEEILSIDRVEFEF